MKKKNRDYHYGIGAMIGMFCLGIVFGMVLFIGILQYNSPWIDKHYDFNRDYFPSMLTNR